VYRRAPSSSSLLLLLPFLLLPCVVPLEEGLACMLTCLLLLLLLLLHPLLPRPHGGWGSSPEGGSSAGQCMREAPSWMFASAWLTCCVDGIH